MDLNLDSVGINYHSVLCISDTIGVTECEDCLAGVRNRMYSWAEGAITTCPE